MKFIEKYKSLSFGIRKKDSSLNYIIIHYSAIKSYKEALSYLSERKNKVSSHFFINKSGEIFYLVDLKNRAWHAGRSYWKGIIDINSESIGIEMDNSGHHYDFENYNPKQIKSLIRLLKYISKRFNINKQNVLGHSDIAPLRKKDPGEKFPWKFLATNKIGIWHIINSKECKKLRGNSVNLIMNTFLNQLKKFGYSTNYSNSKELKKIIKSFQRRFRPELIDGKLDQECFQIIKSLIYLI